MKVILLEDVKGVGKKDQIINANDGYVKNFLLPKKLAVLADKNNLTKMDNIKKIEDAKKQEEYDNALALGKEIEAKTLQMNVKLGNNGKLFGTVTNKEISTALKEQAGIEVDKKKIILSSPIKTLGEKEVSVKLHPKVTVTLKVTISEQK
ncbi:50S ribosomal protein L9 [uncultured Tyzzerella sp.]|uniref:50S ribosomal protein L9 n=1 Tax=uncultured Tyzzerella sp. TaxID=2321398 RepID=UPI0029426ACE|nr:50S ribosomal protein L9 [uncultured Tyzzerella sp.]